MEGLSKAKIKYIESELYDYEDTLMLVRNTRDSIIDDQSIDYSKEKISTSNTYNAVEEKAIELVTNKQLKRAIETIAAIDKAVKVFSEDELEFYKLRYINQIHWKKIISCHMPMSERSYYRIKNKIIETVAIEMGLI